MGSPQHQGCQQWDPPIKSREESPPSLRRELSSRSSLWRSPRNLSRCDKNPCLIKNFALGIRNLRFADFVLHWTGVRTISYNIKERLVGRQNSAGLTKDVLLPCCLRRKRKICTDSYSSITRRKSIGKRNRYGTSPFCIIGLLWFHHLCPTLAAGPWVPRFPWRMLRLLRCTDFEAQTLKCRLEFVLLTGGNSSSWGAKHCLQSSSTCRKLPSSRPSLGSCASFHTSR